MVNYLNSDLTIQKADLVGKRIFVVEDDVVNMAIVPVLLKQKGATVIQDPWNSNSINLLVQNLPIDLIILDLMLAFVAQRPGTVQIRKWAVSERIRRRLMATPWSNLHLFGGLRHEVAYIFVTQ